MLQTDLMQDHELINFYKQGNREAGEELSRRYYAVIRRWCCKYRYYSDDDSDMTQEVLCKLFAEGKIFTFRGESKFKFWLYAVVRNTCIGIIRERKHRPELNFATGDIELEWKKTPAENRSPEEAVLLEEECCRLKQHMGLLSEKYSRPLQAFYFEDQSYLESAGTLGVTLNTFGVQLKRARKILGKLLATRINQPDFALFAGANRSLHN